MFPDSFIRIKKQVGARVKSPNRQSNAGSKKSSPIGVAITPAVLGGLYVGYVSAAALELFAVRRRLPVLKYMLWRPAHSRRLTLICEKRYNIL